MFLFFKKRLPVLVSFITVIAVSASIFGGIFISDGSNIESASEAKSGGITEKSAEKNAVLDKKDGSDAKKDPKPTRVNSVKRESESINRGKAFKYTKVITVKATAYDLSYQSCGKYPGDPGYGITATGTNARKGVVAVDPDVIPLGSKLYIETIDGDIIYREASAEDTGSAIKGNRIDLYFDSNIECRSFGVKSLRVYVLE